MAPIERIKAHINEYGFGFFAIERKDNGQFIGFTGLLHANFESDFTPCVEIGWRLNKDNWGYGFASEAAKACRDFGFNKLKLDDIYSFTSIHNTRSKRVMIDIGMTKCAEFGHPLIEDGNSLKRHLLYKISSDVMPASQY